jgi:hypothetical protein
MRKSYRNPTASVLFDVSAFENKTNLPGAKFLATNIWCGPIRLYARLDTMQWDGHPVDRKQIEEHWMFRIFGKYRVLDIKVSW